jgi:hypothetical protein
MEEAILIRGRLVGPTNVELAEPVADLNAEVEVIIRTSSRYAENNAERAVAFLRSLPPGTRSKEDIDRQVREERESWGDR